MFLIGFYNLADSIRKDFHRKPVKQLSDQPFSGFGGRIFGKDDEVIHGDGRPRIEPPVDYAEVSVQLDAAQLDKYALNEIIKREVCSDLVIMKTRDIDKLHGKDLIEQCIVGYGKPKNIGKYFYDISDCDIAERIDKYFGIHVSVDKVAESDLTHVVYVLADSFGNNLVVNASVRIDGVEDKIHKVDYPEVIEGHRIIHIKYEVIRCDVRYGVEECVRGGGSVGIDPHAVLIRKAEKLTEEVAHGEMVETVDKRVFIGKDISESDVLICKEEYVEAVHKAADGIALFVGGPFHHEVRHLIIPISEEEAETYGIFLIEIRYLFGILVEV